MGIGDWGLGIGDWGLGPIPNPQSPIPNLFRINYHYFIKLLIYIKNSIIYYILITKNKNITLFYMLSVKIINKLKIIKPKLFI